MTESVTEALAKDRADWLLDAVAMATQDRRFLRGDPEYDATAGEAILMNGEKAIKVALSRASQPVDTGVDDLVGKLCDLHRRLLSCFRPRPNERRGRTKQLTPEYRDVEAVLRAAIALDVARITPPLDSAVDTGCPSCGGLNIACPDGCGRDTETGELNGTRLTLDSEADLEAAWQRILADNPHHIDGCPIVSWRSFRAALISLANPNPVSGEAVAYAARLAFNADEASLATFRDALADRGVALLSLANPQDAATKSGTRL